MYVLSSVRQRDVKIQLASTVAWADERAVASRFEGVILSHRLTRPTPASATHHGG